MLDEHHLLAAVRYVENNPVAVGMVKHAWEYAWSSAKCRVGDIKKDVLVNGRNLYGLVNDWRKYLDEQIEESDNVHDVHNIRKSTKTGRPAGDYDFVKKVEKLTGRSLRREKPGPKKKRG